MENVFLVHKFPSRKQSRLFGTDVRHTYDDIYSVPKVGNRSNVRNITFERACYLPQRGVLPSQKIKNCLDVSKKRSNKMLTYRP